jgi:hypothetical protein
LPFFVIVSADVAESRQTSGAIHEQASWFGTLGEFRYMIRSSDAREETLGVAEGEQAR